MIQSWEYMETGGSLADDIGAELNSFGKQGWELIFFVILPGNYPQTWIAVFKRPLAGLE